MTYSIDELLEAYGEGDNYPTRSQWQRLLDGDMNQPLTVLNLFKLRDIADQAFINEDISGEQAFARYAEVSVPKVAQMGGRFLLRGAVEGGFIGSDLEGWHIVAIGQYPKRKNFLELLSDPDYREVYKYRQAAIDVQNVFFINAA